MLCAVIPIQNENQRLGRVLANIATMPIDCILPVVNGSSDGSQQIIKSYSSKLINMIHFKEPLGIDIPRAVGAVYAHRLGADSVLFIDGDMTGNIRPTLEQLIQAVQGGIDLALTDCYPGEDWRRARASPLAKKILGLREELNRNLGLEHLGTASPSHGPHAVSRRFLNTIPLRELGVPPVALVLAARRQLRIEVAAALPHRELGSSDRGSRHAQLIAQTIIGDHLEAFCVLENKKRARLRDGIVYDGYHTTRRWDLLDAL